MFDQRDGFSAGRVKFVPRNIPCSGLYRIEYALKELAKSSLGSFRISMNNLELVHSEQPEFHVRHVDLVAKPSLAGSPVLRRNCIRRAG